jgi:hypothetical protein
MDIYHKNQKLEEKIMLIPKFWHKSMVSVLVLLVVLVIFLLSACSTHKDDSLSQPPAPDSVKTYPTDNKEIQVWIKFSADSNGYVLWQEDELTGAYDLFSRIGIPAPSGKKGMKTGYILSKDNLEPGKTYHFKVSEYKESKSDYFDADYVKALVEGKQSPAITVVIPN